MKQKMLTIVLTISCVILLIICYMLGSKHDREAPVIKIKEMNLTFTEGDDESSLLEGVTATDNVDGDVTDQIFIEKILPIDEKHAVVSYCVLDQSNNVGTAERKILYYPKEEQSEDDSDSGLEKLSEDDTSKEMDSEEYGVPQPQGDPELSPDGERPVLALVSDQIKIKAGDSFEPVSVVWGVADDKDTQDELYQHIHIEGEYDTYTPGTYEIQYYVSDNDQNTSDPQIMTLTVE